MTEKVVIPATALVVIPATALVVIPATALVVIPEVSNRESIYWIFVFTGMTFCVRMTLRVNF